MKRILDWLAIQTEESATPHRRGSAQQLPRRQLEQTVRGDAAKFCNQTMAEGFTRAQAAAHLHVSPWTLRGWQCQLGRGGDGAALLGRPVQRSPRADRNQVLDLLVHQGPATSLPTLCEQFAHMPRAELDDLLKRYRGVFARRYHESPRVLHWQLPGSVWAIDFAEPSEPGGRVLPPIDGVDAYLLAVRDLASGQQLLWLPVEVQTAAEVTTALAGLFALYGPPLVLKSDNGPAFTAEPTQAFLESAGVLSLFSPPYWPAYNGAIEAGIGSLKMRTARHAARHGHPGLWTCDDLAAARLEANTAARPQGPSPAQLWQARRPLSAAERLNFQATVGRLRPEARVEQGLPADGRLEPTTQRAVDRRALERALVEHDYLLYTRRRIPLRIRRAKVTGDM